MKWAIDFCSGSISGVFGVMLGYPLDIIKCRMQIKYNEYKNISTAAIKIIKEEKIWGLYKGCSVPLLNTFPINAVYFL
jgi:hypothetical protein